MLQRQFITRQRHTLSVYAPPLMRTCQRQVHGVRTSFTKLRTAISPPHDLILQPSAAATSWCGEVGGIDQELRRHSGLFGTRRTDAFCSATNSGDSSPNLDPSSQPIRKTELKKKKTAAVAETKEVHSAQTDGKRPATASTAKESPAPSKAAVIFRKIAVDFPKTLASKTYEFFRLMIFGVWRVRC
jgi:hypothetical protein